MTSSAKDIFMDAVELPPAERGAFLAKACAADPKLRERVDALLQANVDASSVFGAVSPALFTELEEIGPGAILQSYKLVEEIGAGGFGTVWLAEQTEPFERLVAIKILKAGMDSEEVVARFGAERQALALMDHSAIAKVFDAGTTPRGRLFFAMELVDGQTITKYCEEKRLGTRGRVELVIQVCEGLKHAHQKGVIHRDIKPSNVLVVEQDGKALAKIIDFGIAKAIGGRLAQVTLRTRVDQIIGTPGYMSPEQLGEASDVDTRSDVYSVGALLYELLTGERPLKLTSGNFAEVQAKIANEVPIRPSTKLRSSLASEGRSSEVLTREVRGDLDWIVMRCLEKDRERRYESIGFLAADLIRFQQGMPVEAGPPTLRYRASKFARRHWRVLSAAAVVFVLLAGSSVISARQAKLADKARIVAEEAEAETKRELVRASAVAEFLENLLTSIDPANAAGRDTSLIKEVLQSATEDVESASKGVPSVEVQLRSILGAARISVGEYAAAAEQLERAFVLAQELFGDESSATLHVAMNLGGALGESGDFERARELSLFAYEGYKRGLGSEHESTRLALSNLTTLLINRGSPEGLEPLLRELERVTTLDNGSEHEDSLRVRNNLAVLLSNIGQVEEAKELFEGIAEIQRAQLTAEHPRTMATMNNLAGVYEELGQVEDAERIYRELLEAKTRVLPVGHPSLLIGMNNLANFLGNHGSEVEAGELRQDAIALALQHHGVESRFTLTLMVGEGIARLESEDFEEAERLLQQVLDHAAPVFGENSQLGITAASCLAQVFVLTERAEEACELMAPMIEVIPEAFPEFASPRRVYPARYGLMLHAAGRVEEAKPFLERAQLELADDSERAKLLSEVVSALGSD